MNEAVRTRHRKALRHLESLLDAREHEEVLRDADRIEAEWGRTSDVIGLATLWLYRAESHYFLGQLKPAQSSASDAFEVLRASAEHGLYARTKFLFGLIARDEGEYPEARDQFDEARVSYRRAGDVEGQIRSLARLAAISFLQSNYSRALEVIRQCIALCVSTDSGEMLIKETRNKGRICLIAGDLDDAEECLAADKADVESGRVADPMVICRYHLSVGYLHTLRRKFDQAEHHLELARKIAESGLFSKELVIYNEYKGEMELFRGDPQAALDHFEAIFSLADSFDLTANARSQGYRLLSEALVALNRLSEAEAASLNCEEAASKVREGIEMAITHRVRGEIAAKRGKGVSARDEFLEARRLLSQMGAKYELARTDLMIGQCECFEFKDRVAACANAERAFEQIGVPPLAEAAAEQLSVLVEALAPTNGSPAGRRAKSVTTDSEPPLFIAEDPKTVALQDVVERIKDADDAILITGETGVGKDLAAEFIHATGKRARRPFLNIHVINIPKDLWESELFGYEKGAFTSAEQTKPGHLERANGGTVVLNEIGELPERIQAKLLRFLDSKRFHRVGGTDEIEVDVRIIAATNRDLAQDVQTGRFRKDLYYRLNKYSIEIPPLRERRGDILPMVQHFLRREFGDAPSLVALERTKFGKLMKRHHWDGNVRFLKTVVGQLSLACPDCDPEKLVFIAEKILNKANGQPLNASEEENKQLLIAALRQSRGVKRQAARILDRRSEAWVRQNMKKFGLRSEDFE